MKHYLESIFGLEGRMALVTGASGGDRSRTGGRSCRGGSPCRGAWDEI
ncbi:MAG: hypothetical protein KatS3mg104_0946 [Phycisphaerae bacterium]|nr:MAG: hypothetical protein KatS3mg104_0946 [Phycisphaerae bacterium]